jgi:hypothetical protein
MQVLSHFCHLGPLKNASSKLALEFNFMTGRRVMMHGFLGLPDCIVGYKHLFR